MKNVFKVLAIIALVSVIGFSFIACGGGSDNNFIIPPDPPDVPGSDGTTDTASFVGTWNASGGRSIVFSGSTFNYKVNGTTTYSGTFSVSGSTITFNATGLGTASGNFALTATTLVLSNHTWDSSVNGTYTKDNGSTGGTDTASFAGTWNASGGRSIVFSGSTFNYKVNGTTTYSGTFSVSGSTITFNATGLGTASGNYTLTATTLVLSNHTWDSSVNGTYTKDGGGGGGQSVSYIINGSGTTFTATKNGATVGTANQSISNVISSIQTDANGANVAIQFGNGTSVLDIGTAYVSFSNYSGTWGSITISGKVTSSSTSSDTVSIGNGISVTSTTDITATGSGRGIGNSRGTLIINSGSVSATGTGIQNYGGTLTINSGNVSSTGKDGISNEENGTVTINGGTVSTANTDNTNKYALKNSSGCTATITGGTLTSANATSTVSGAISNSGTLNISNGTFRSTGSSSKTIENGSGGILTVTGGTVESTGNFGSAVSNAGGTVTISGGTVSATGGSSSYAVDNRYGGGTVTITSPPAVINGNKGGI